jgi:hypothetical protein
MVGLFTVTTLLGLLLGGFVLSPPAKADSTDTCTFSGNEVTPLGLDVTSLSWQVPASPIQIAPSNIDLQFSVMANLLVNGASVGPTLITFGNGPGTGGFNNIPSLDFVAFGAPPWRGSATSPTFVLGAYPLNASDTLSPPVGTLTVSQSVVSTPEPGILSLLSAGLLTWFLTAGFFRNYRSRVNRTEATVPNSL